MSRRFHPLGGPPSPSLPKWGDTSTRSCEAINQTSDLGTSATDNRPITYQVVEVETVGIGN